MASMLTHGGGWSWAELGSFRISGAPGPKQAGRPAPPSGLAARGRERDVSGNGELGSFGEGYKWFHFVRLGLKNGFVSHFSFAKQKQVLYGAPGLAVRFEFVE